MADRMSYSEAVESVGRLIAAFPNGTPANAKGYIGALAAVLVDYPRVVAAKCSDPLKGVARETRFLPTVADLVGWCEREKAGLQTIVDREDHAAAVARKARELAQEESALAEARKTRPTLQQMQEKHGPNWGLSVAEKQDLIVKAARDNTMKRANAAAFEAECRAAGVDPECMPISPSLAKMLGKEATELEARMRNAEALGRQADKLTAQEQSA
jgi:hypothetical protein